MKTTGFVRNGKLAYKLVFDEPLIHGGNQTYNYLRTAISQLGVKTVDDLNEENVEDRSIIN